MCRAFEHPLLAPVFLSFVVERNWKWWQVQWVFFCLLK
jgi:hypothetical protein